MNRVQRARGINQIMTGVFYLIAVFFFTLLIGFASYVCEERISYKISKNLY